MKPSLASLDSGRVPFVLKPWACVLGAVTTFDQAKEMRNSGAITFKQWRWYLLIWTWSTVRYSNLERAGDKQDRCYAAHGMAGLERRFARVQRLRERLWSQHFAPYFKQPAEALTCYPS